VVPARLRSDSIGFSTLVCFVLANYPRGLPQGNSTTASAITSRKGSQALALGARPADSGRWAVLDRWTPPRYGRFWGPEVGQHPPCGGRFCPSWVGGHPRNGRFWRPLPRPTASATHRHAGSLQVSARRLPTDACGLFDSPQRPAQSPKRQYLLLLLVAQDVAHPGDGSRPHRLRQRPGALLVVAGFQVSISGRFRPSTKVRRHYSVMAHRHCCILGPTLLRESCEGFRPNAPRAAGGGEYL